MQVQKTTRSALKKSLKIERFPEFVHSKITSYRKGCKVCKLKRSTSGGNLRVNKTSEKLKTSPRGQFNAHLLISPPKVLKNKGVQVSTTLEGPSKDLLISKIEIAIQSYKSEVDILKRKHNAELMENLRLVEDLHRTIEEISRENTEKDRFINQLKNNLELMEDKVNEMTKQRDNWRNEVDLFKNYEYASISELRKTMEDTDDYETQVRDFKDQIFAFLLTERNRGMDKTRAEFYKSIINLLKFANDSEKETKFDLSSLVSYFSTEGKEHFGQDYQFHNFDHDEKYHVKAESDYYGDFRKSTEKDNKSETGIVSFQKGYKRMNSQESANFLSINDAACLTEIGSTTSKKMKKKKNKRTKLLEEKVRDLSNTVTKQKAEVETLQSKLKESSVKAPKGLQTIKNMASLERSSNIRTTKRFHSPVSLLSSSPRETRIPPPSCDEALLQYVHLLSKCTEESIEERRTIRKSTGFQHLSAFSPRS
ncbi:unnamed protein product [Moneuplotes crassus]|uniref:Uncharacterized protein n=1 Tax=Euplotes crassus TaxID=5936 RepID=A0AAD1UL14_EUPCR|nr:unnamed protein product [Moneuplotes crassus]